MGVNERFLAQWCPHERRDGGFDWTEIFKRFREPNRLDIAISVGDRLSGLGLATMTNQHVCLRFLEGDPRSDCPLTGRRALIALETAAAYAQALGRKELRLYPVNSSLETLYIETYGFTLERPRKEEPYLRKGV